MCLRIKHGYGCMIWGALLSCAMGVELSAQTVPSDSVRMSDTLDEVVVTGTGTQHYSWTVPVRTEVVGKQDLLSISGHNVQGILTTISPSFDAISGSMGSGISLGGLGNNYILVLVNGKRLHGDVGGENDLSKIDASRIEKIEIVKGAASTLYGSDAIAGVINIITKDYTDTPLSLVNSTRFGSYGQLQQSNTVAWGYKRISSVTQFSSNRSKAWQNSSQELYRNTLYENSTTETSSAFNNWNIQQELAWRPNKQWEVKAMGMLYKKRIFHSPGAPRWRMYNLRYNDQSASVEGTYRSSASQTFSLLASFDRHAYFYDYYNRYMDEYIKEELLDDGRVHYVPVPYYYQPGESSLESDQRQSLLRGKGVMQLGEKHRLTAGFEGILDYLIAQNRMPNGSASAYTLAAYSQDEWQVTPELNVTAGLRYIYHKAFGSYVTPKVSFQYIVSDANLQLRGTYGRGFKTPTIKEIYYEYERPMMGKLRVYLGNPALRPQVSDYGSMGVSYNPLKTLNLHLYGSYNHLRDMITLILVKVPPKYGSDEGREVDGAMQYVNAEKARVWEVECALTWRPISSIKLSAAYTYNNTLANVYDAKLTRKGEEPVIVSHPIDGTSPHKATVGATYTMRKKGYQMTAGLHGRMQSERYYAYFGNALGYSLWNISNTHKWSRKNGWTYQLTLGMNNIFDYKETHPYGYNYGTKTPGRTYYATLRIEFKQDKE